MTASAGPSPLRRPSPGRRPMEQYSSTTTLLQEISTLRSRLKDLEDDTKSSVVGSPIHRDEDDSIMMKKEIAKLQEEKANQEKDFLNQMTRLQVEKQKEVEELLDKLNAATANASNLDKELAQVRQAASDLRSVQGCDTEDQYTRKLQDLKEAHAKEMDQMKENLVSADREISESRGEIDILQEELDEMQNHRQALLDEVTSTRMELNQEQKKSDRLQKEVNSYKQTVQDKENENGVLVAKIMTLETQSKSLSDQVTTLKVNTSLQAVSTDSDDTISPTEKGRLIRDMQELEDRLVKFHTKLAEKDSKIDELTATLVRERSLTKKLKSGKDAASPPTTPTLKRSAASPTAKKPAVAGLVASFERRLGHPVEEHVDRETDSPTSVSFDTVLDSSDASILKQKLKTEKDLVFNLQTKLNAEKTKVVKLTDDLKEERQTVSDLRGLVEAKSSSRHGDQNNTEMVEKLRTELAEAKNAQTSSISLGAKERSELTRLRSEAVYAKVIRDDLELKLQHDNEELERLRAQLTQMEHRGAIQDEKKEVDSDEVAALQSLVSKKEKALERLRKKYKEYEVSTDETLKRLRNQVEALQSELEKAMSKVEQLEGQLSDADDNKIKAETMELDLTMANAQNAELFNQHKTTVQSMEEKINSLERKVDSLEMQNNELALSIDAPSDYEKECKKLKQQLTNAQDQLEAIEADHEAKVQGLERRIQELTNDLELERKKALTTIENHHQEEASRLAAELRRLRLEKATMEREHSDRVEKLEKEMETIEIETDQQLETKQDLIDKLTESLLSKGKTVPPKVATDVSFSRKDELKEVNDELLDIIAQNKSYAREIHELQSTIQHLSSTRGGTDSASYQRRITDLEDEIIALDNELRQQTDRESVSKLKNENSQLREFVRELKLERRQLREKCDSGSEKGGSKSSQLLREKNAKLKQEVDKLTRRLRKLEDSITRVAV